MRKVVITSTLADTLKTMRNEKKMPSKELAEKWGKSPSYVSKLENGLLKTLDEEDLMKVLNIIVDNSNDVNDVINEIYKTLTFKYTKAEIEEMIWVDNFDTIYRKIPVSDALIADINLRLTKGDISIERLVTRINNNEALPQKLKEDPDWPNNIWKSYDSNDNDKGTYIKVLVLQRDVKELLGEDVKTTNYLTLYAICYYLTKIEKFQDIQLISNTDDRRIRVEAIEYLERFKVYKMLKRLDIIEGATAENEYCERLSEHDNENVRIVRDVYQAIELYSTYDVAMANRQMEQMIINMRWDSPFIMQIAGLEFSKLGECSYRIKKQILSEIGDILKKTIALPDKEKRREEY